jgi:peptidoglycan hydrolase-like protein with peptidoglycan-binding domain
VHQYRGGHDEVHGGVRINIDSNFLDVGKGSVARAARSWCGGVRVDFPTYPRLDTGVSKPARVRAAQCFLTRKGFYTGPINGVYDAPTGAAASAYRARAGLPASTAFDRRAWVAIMSAGKAPLMKYGSVGPAVRRVQRALNAAGTPKLAVTGVFEGTTTAAVRSYQSARGLPATGVVTEAVWARMRAGR